MVQSEKMGFIGATLGRDMKDYGHRTGCKQAVCMLRTAHWLAY